MYGPGLFLWSWGSWRKDVGCVTKVHLQLSSFMSTLCILLTSIILYFFTQPLSGAELKPACPYGSICSSTSNAGVPAHEKPYLGARAVPPFSPPKVPNLVVHFPYIYHQWSRYKNSLSHFRFILILKSSNWQVKSLLVFHVIMKRKSLPTSQHWRWASLLRTVPVCYGWT